MTKLENKAYQAAKNEDKLWLISPIDAFAKGYEKGFKAAREMAVYEAINYPTTDDEGEPTEPYSHCCTCGGGPGVAEFIKKIGEE